jgi:tetratricopeptide (TPR) repeat protein
MGAGGEGKARRALRRGLLLALLPLLLLPACSRVIVVKDPLTAREHVDLGLSYEKKEKYERAEREYRAAAKKDGRLYAARYNLGNVLMKTGRNGEARREYLAALEARPGAVEASNNLAWAAIRSGEGMEEAREILAAVLAGAAGRRPDLLDTYGFLLLRQGRAKEGEAVLREAEEKCMTGSAPCPEETLREIWVHLADTPGGGGTPPPVPPPGRPGGGPVR